MFGYSTFTFLTSIPGVWLSISASLSEMNAGNRSSHLAVDKESEKRLLFLYSHEWFIHSPKRGKKCGKETFATEKATRSGYEQSYIFLLLSHPFHFEISWRVSEPLTNLRVSSPQLWICLKTVLIIDKRTAQKDFLSISHPKNLDSTILAFTLASSRSEGSSTT